MNILNWLANLIQQNRLIIAQSDEAYRQRIYPNSFLMDAKIKLDKFFAIINGHINSLRKTNSSANSAIRIMVLALAIMLGYWIIKRYRGNQPPPSKKPERQASKQNLLKKNTSFVSIKQYQSHSNSDSEDESQEKQTKKAKEYCTDIETEPQNCQYESALELKRDKFFFTLIGSFKNSKKSNALIPDENSQLDYQCEYEGEQELSPKKLLPKSHPNEADIPKIVIQ